MLKCLSCLRGFPEECRGGGCSGSTQANSVQIVETQDEPNDVPARRARTRRNKPDSALKDQQSTGRKRAARLYPFIPDALCEWHDASPTNPKGGGEYPITVGCPDNERKQQARHHGPDKNTTNNEPGNVHRICHWHHNNWHAKNDPDYDPNKPLKD